MMTESPTLPLIKLMLLAGIPFNELKTRFVVPGTKSNVTIAAPKIKFCITFPGDSTEGLDDEGWTIFPVSTDDARVFGKVFAAVDEMEVAATYASVEGPASNVSKSENLLYDALVREGAVKGEFEMSRSKKFYTDKGEYISQPDFVWESEKFIVEFDGLWNHGGREDTDLVKNIRDAKNDKIAKNLVGRKSSKQARDSKKRRYLSELGYNVMVITDEDFYGDGAAEAVEEAASSILRALRRRRNELHGISDEQADSIEDMFNSDDGEDEQNEPSDSETDKNSDADLNEEADEVVENNIDDEDSDEDDTASADEIELLFSSEDDTDSDDDYDDEDIVFIGGDDYDDESFDDLHEDQGEDVELQDDRNDMLTSEQIMKLMGRSVE